MITIAIHYREGSFSDRWIKYCQENNVKYILVNCYDTNIVNTLTQNKVTHIMWHINHASNADVISYNYVLNAADNLNIKTFPNYNTRWHFDDKIAQKYLLESIGAPLVDSYVFYDKDDATSFIDNYQLPVVAKLKRGAGASNVQLLHTKAEAAEYLGKMFGEGINPLPKTFENFDQKLRVAKKLKNPLAVLKKLSSYIAKNKKQRTYTVLEKGYLYLQKFLPGNDFDTRIIVVGKKAFGVRRFNRDNDFRASGSGKSDFAVKDIDIETVKIAFDITRRLNTQSLAFDFVYDEKKQAKVIEVCFGFNMNFYNPCEGYWNEDLSFVEGPFNPQAFMVSDFIADNKPSA